MPKPTISALVVIYNEETILEDCLSRLGWVNDLVVVLDKCSDNSKEIALRHNARLLEGAWEIEGSRRNAGIDFCQTDWILEVDADEWISEELAAEIRDVIKADEHDVYNLKVENYIGGTLVEYGWGGSFGKAGYIGLFRKGAKSWGMQRLHPHLTVSGNEAGADLEHPVIHHTYKNISEMLRKLDRYSTLRAKDLADNGEVTSLANAFRKFISRFYKSYIYLKGYKSGGYGFMLALCGALYPLLANLKAYYEEQPNLKKPS